MCVCEYQREVGDRKLVLSYLVLIFNCGNVRVYKNLVEYKEINFK